jgi:predicted RNA binding protein YcfA (HicA-like mRNA interferase family)
MPKKWPPLNVGEVIAILKALGFTYKTTIGGHHQYEGVSRGKRCKVTVSAHEAEFDNYLLPSMCGQANVSRDEFYGATKATARKAQVKWTKKTDAEEV